MFIKDRNILPQNDEDELVNNKNLIDKDNMRKAWGDAFDYYFRGISEKYLNCHDRATRLEFWGFYLVSFIIFFPFYFIGNYIDVPFFAYYFLLATILPSFCLLVRRFHDINKKAFPYLLIGILSGISAFFIGVYSLVLVLIWFVYMVYLLSKPTDTRVMLFGEADETDEVFGDDNIKIIKKFRFLAIVLFFVFLAVSYTNFEIWSDNNLKRVGHESIMMSIAEKGRQNGMSAEQIKTIQKSVEDFVKANPAVSEDVINSKEYK